MINIKYGDEKYSIKSNPKEISISEFETISEILSNSDFDFVDKYSKIFKLLGCPEKIVDEIDYEEFVEVILAFKKSFTADNVFTREVEINGYKYVAFEGEEFRLKTKDMALINKSIKDNPDKFLGETLAVIYKREDLGPIEHYEPAHLKNKAKIFREHLKLDVALPYIPYISEKLINSIKLLKDDES